jgi:transposase-like protein
METKVYKFVRWLCSKFTKTEIEQIIKELTDVITGHNTELKPEDDFKQQNPHYQNYYPDPTLPLTEPKLELPKLNWQTLLDEYKIKNGKPLSPVNPKNLNNKVPDISICRVCGAPSDYLYYNDGKKRTQIKCKVCNSLSQVNPGFIYKSKYWCPYCNSPLQKRKHRTNFDLYRCENDSCPFYISNKKNLTFSEKLLFTVQPFNFKLRYHYHDYHFSSEQLSLSSPNSEFSKLFNIHNSLHTLALILTFHISFAISARKTAYLLKKVFLINLSYQSVLNYAQYSACYCHKFNLHFKSPVDDIITGDEKYLKVAGKKHHAYFFLNARKHSIASYHLSPAKDALPATISLNSAISNAPPDQHITAITDKDPSYIHAVNFINRSRPSNPVDHKIVIGLENLDPQSEEFRPFKQIIERFNRTCKYHIKPAAGFNIFNGALAITVLFATHYNFLRPHMVLNYSVPVHLEEIQSIPTIQGQWAKILEIASKL